MRGLKNSKMKLGNCNKRLKWWGKKNPREHWHHRWLAIQERLLVFSLPSAPASIFAATFHLSVWWVLFIFNARVCVCTHCHVYVCVHVCVCACVHDCLYVDACGWCQETRSGVISQSMHGVPPFSLVLTKETKASSGPGIPISLAPMAGIPSTHSRAQHF